MVTIMKGPPFVIDWLVALVKMEADRGAGFQPAKITAGWQPAPRRLSRIYPDQASSRKDRFMLKRKWMGLLIVLAGLFALAAFLAGARAAEETSQPYVVLVGIDK